jgi:hypothetical protein
MKLSNEQVKLAEQLLLTIIKKEPYVEYKELGDRVNPPIFHRQVPGHIAAISELCYELGLPFLSAKVISKGKDVAGSGFYKLYVDYFPDVKNKTPREVFIEECKRIRECQEWYKLADYLNLNLNFPRPTKQIRILPMSSIEFPDATSEDVQRMFFLNDLKHRENGKYRYRNQGMKAPVGSLILFQFQNMIIASAILAGNERFDTPEDHQYSGAYYFDTSSIRIFDPILIDEINAVVPHITKFSQVKQEIDSQYWDEVEELIHQKQRAYLADEISSNQSAGLMEGAKRQIVVNAYERNPKARQLCIAHYGCKCFVCGFDFSIFYGPEFKGKIHVHHLKPLSEINESYEVDPISDLRPVCPNCHLALHSKGAGEVYGMEELRGKIRV